MLKSIIMFGIPIKTQELRKFESVLNEKKRIILLTCSDLCCSFSVVESKNAIGSVSSLVHFKTLNLLSNKKAILIKQFATVYFHTLSTLQHYTLLNFIIFFIIFAIAHRCLFSHLLLLLAIALNMVLS